MRNATPSCRRSQRPTPRTGSVGREAARAVVPRLHADEGHVVRDREHTRPRAARGVRLHDEATTLRLAPRPSGSASRVLEEAGFATGRSSCSTAAEEIVAGSRQPRLRRYARDRRRARAAEGHDENFVARAVLCAARPCPDVPPGYVDPPLLAAAAREIGEATSLRHVLGHGLRRRRRPDVRERRQHRLAAHRLARELHAHDRLGSRHEHRDVRPQAGLEPRVVEVRSRLAGRHADANADAADAHRQRPPRLAHRRRRRARRRAARARGALSARSLAQSRRASSRPRGCRARIPSRSGAGSSSRKAATATSSQPEKVHVVAITMLGKYRVDATINSQNVITRIKTTVSEPALGDFNIEHESTDFVTVGNVKWPTAWHSHHGWDDNWQFYRQSTGHNGYGGEFRERAAERLRRSAARAARRSRRRRSRRR